ncbi:hypothetical protein CK203_045832 [Vitis vinifera]|uniref:Reverse transcriptase domain-containing protein n=1 Tax=Vitis vinifera TaxID=29760 RepID=A0A438FMQ2_VITVI|nr:hypothetical protein CK203_045832 [Vitis vinifera]
MDGDDSITNVATPDFISIEGASGPVDPPLSFHSISGFITRYDYPKWLANFVPILKKDDKVRVCVDFRDLNKVNPKDDFSLPHIDMLVDSTTGHSMLSFMDGFSGVMPFGLKNAGATYQRAATNLFHDMMHKDVEFRLRLNPKKYTFGVISRKLLGHIVSERGIEVDMENIGAILDMPALRTEREIRGFLGILQYSSRMSPFSSSLVPPTPGHSLLLCLSVSDMALGCMLTQLDDLGNEQVIYYLKFDIQYVTQKSVKDSIVADHLASLLVSDDTQNDDDFPNEQFVSVASIAGWCLDFDGVVNQSRFGIGILLISPQTVGDPYGFQLGYTTDLGFDELRNIHLPRAENQFVDALATLASMIEIPTGMTMQPLLIETIFALAYFCLIGNIEDQVELPWYHDIHQFLAYGAYLESATTKDRKH